MPRDLFLSLPEISQLWENQRAKGKEVNTTNALVLKSVRSNVRNNFETSQSLCPGFPSLSKKLYGCTTPLGTRSASSPHLLHLLFSSEALNAFTASLI